MTYAEMMERVEEERKLSRSSVSPMLDDNLVQSAYSTSMWRRDLDRGAVWDRLYEKAIDSAIRLAAIALNTVEYFIQKQKESKES